MMESPIPRRPSRAARPRYRALVTLVFPADADERRRRRAGESCLITAWAKVNPGELVPDALIEETPGLVSKGRVEPMPAAGGEE